MGLLELYYGLPSILKEAEKVDKAFRGTYLAVIFWCCNELMAFGFSIFALLTVFIDKPLFLSFIYSDKPHTFDTTLYTVVYDPWVDIVIYLLLFIFLANAFTSFSELSGGCDIP